MFKFIKLHANGNNFIFFFNKKKKFFLKKILNKINLSCDQILIIENINFKNNTLKLKIFNNDISIAKNCGNGVRCLSWYFLLKKKKNEILNFILKKNFIFSFKNKFYYTIYNLPKNNNIYIRIEKIFLKTFFINLINFHLVFIIKNINSKFLKNISKKIIFFFNDIYNLEFLQFINKSNFYIRIFERKVGETYSCGSGILSAMSIINFYFKNKHFKINSLGGCCYVSVINKFILIYGKINFIFFGYI